MMNVSQAIALAVAQAQPSASSSPNKARFRGTVVPAVSAPWAIVLHPPLPGVPGGRSFLDGQRSGHVGVDRAVEGVRARVEGGHVIGLGRDARENLALEELGAGAVLDRDVVLHAGILVVEGDLEALVGR